MFSRISQVYQNRNLFLWYDFFTLYKDIPILCYIPQMSHITTTCNTHATPA